MQPMTPTIGAPRISLSLGQPLSSSAPLPSRRSLALSDALEIAPAGELKCPRGHVMFAKVVREISYKISEMRWDVECDLCGAIINYADGRYRCKECDYDLCLPCAHRLQDPTPTSKLTRHLGSSFGLPAPGLNAGSHVTCGDLIFCGPDAWGVHHVVVVCGPLKRDPEAAGLLNLPPHFETFAAETVESNRHQEGRETLWYRVTSIYARDVRSGEVYLVGDTRPGSTVIERCSKVPVKILFHPCREGSEGPTMMPNLWAEALEEMSELSGQWSLMTAMQALVSSASRQGLDPEDYPSPEDREELMEELEESWSSRPICSACAIRLWQRYFQLLAERHSDARHGSVQDQAAQHILRWIPLVSDQTSPSLLLKVLSRCGWTLRGSLIA